MITTERDLLLHHLEEGSDRPPKTLSRRAHTVHVFSFFKGNDGFRDLNPKHGFKFSLFFVDSWTSLKFENVNLAQNVKADSLFTFALLSWESE